MNTNSSNKPTTETKVVHPAVSEYFSRIGKIGGNRTSREDKSKAGKRSWEVRRKKICNEPDPARDPNC